MVVQKFKVLDPSFFVHKLVF